jgi:uncharacterized membrane protein YeaQ/YmgE (transglycosylase-associated protein family)
MISPFGAFRWNQNLPALSLLISNLAAMRLPQARGCRSAITQQRPVGVAPASGLDLRHALAILPTFGYQRRDFVVVLHIIWLIILGLVVGLIARAIVPGRQPMGWIATAVLGIVGAYVGGTLGSVVFPPHQFDIHPPIKHSFLGALVGAVLLLVIYKVVTSRTRTL